jgi:methyl-accepting chemotaxis protein
MPAERRLDAALPVAVLANAALLAGLAWSQARGAGEAPGATLAAGLLCLVGLWCMRQPPQGALASWGSATVLVTLLVAQMAVAGAAVPLLLLNSLLVLSLLPNLRRPGLVVAGGVAAAAAPWLLHEGLARGPLQSAWLQADGSLFAYGVAMAVHTLLLALTARANAYRARERFDMHFLVRAMGIKGPIRLSLDAVRAESALGERLKDVQQRMAGTLRQVSRATHGVQAASSELQHSGEELGQRTERSAAGLREAAMTLEQINLIVQTSAEAALDARAMAVQAAAQAEQGGELFDQVRARMRDIDAASRSITEVIGVIEGIAFQTNILALNAAVEAARAGDRGRGFAVVAAEVRQLALRSATAAGEIKTLIERSTATVASGNALVERAGRTMVEIVASARKVGGAFEHLSADTTEHAGSIDAVTAAVRDLDEMTRQNVAVAETSRRIADDLQTQSHMLEEVLGAFQLGTDTQAPADADAPPGAMAARTPSATAAAAPQRPQPLLPSHGGAPRPTRVVAATPVAAAASAAAPPGVPADNSNVVFF